jgi:hypothetical protein
VLKIKIINVEGKAGEENKKSMVMREILGLESEWREKFGRIKDKRYIKHQRCISFTIH